MGLFNRDQNQEAQPISQRQQLANRYASARHNILLVLIFTTINLILLVANRNSYFLFSAYIPYAIVSWGMFLCGKYPAEFYIEFEDFVALDSSLLVITLVVAVVICVLYLLCWLFSDKRRVGWMIAVLVLFAVDTILMVLGGISLDSVMDVVFHAWVVISLSMGTIAHFKLKKLPEEEPASAELPQA